MVGYSDIRRTSSSVAFFFSCLGVFLGSSSYHYPRVGDFVLSDNSLGLMFNNLFPLLRQSLDWFRCVQESLRRENMDSDVRLGDLETGLSSSAGMAEAEMDTATSMPSSVSSSSYPFVSNTSRPFHALKEKCSLKGDTFKRFRDRFQFPEETRVHLPRKGEKSCAFTHGEVCFYEAAFLCGLRFPVHPFLMELLHHLNIAPRQLMPNSWRIVISCMVIWTIIADGDMITLNEFVYLNCLKESKEFGYYELVPWDKRSQLIVDLPSSFHYWKSRYFFMSGDSWETFSNDFWGDVPWLLRRWETPQLGMFASYVLHFSFNITCFDCPF